MRNVFFDREKQTPWSSASLHLARIDLDESMRVLNISRTWHPLKADENQLHQPLDVGRSARVWRMAEIVAKAQQVQGTST